MSTYPYNKTKPWSELTEQERQAAREKYDPPHELMLYTIRYISKSVFIITRRRAAYKQLELKF